MCKALGGGNKHFEALFWSPSPKHYTMCVITCIYVCDDMHHCIAHITYTKHYMMYVMCVCCMSCVFDVCHVYLMYVMCVIQLQGAVRTKKTAFE